MLISTFFGHRDSQSDIEERIRKAIRDLIEYNRVEKFYVGNQGNFDKMVFNILKDFKKVYPNIKFYVVLAYIPFKDIQIYCDNSIIPDGIEAVPPKYAINYRNKWMIDNADIVVSYVTREFGGAAKFTKYAERKKKRIVKIEL